MRRISKTRRMIRMRKMRKMRRMRKRNSFSPKTDVLRINKVMRLGWHRSVHRAE